MSEPAEVVLRAQEALHNFVRVELDMCLELASLALRSTDPEKVRRNRENAAVGYNNALRFFPRVELSDTDRESIERSIEQLRQLLIQLNVLCELPGHEA